MQKREMTHLLGRMNWAEEVRKAQERVYELWYRRWLADNNIQNSMAARELWNRINGVKRG